MADDVRILPTEWVGTSTEVSWGLVFGGNHPKFETHGHLDPAVHTQTTDAGFRIVAQEGRVVELRIVGNFVGEIPAVGLLSADATQLEISGPMGHASYVINGNTMVGHTHYRLHGTQSAGEEYGVGMMELTAKA